LEDALAQYARPQFFNSDQGSQFTSAPSTDVLITNDVAISVNGKDGWRDNAFVEHFWRTVKYEELI
jgi:putative transposase